MCTREDYPIEDYAEERRWGLMMFPAGRRIVRRWDRYQPTQEDTEDATDEPHARGDNETTQAK